MYCSKCSADLQYDSLRLRGCCVRHLEWMEAILFFYDVLEAMCQSEQLFLNFFRQIQLVSKLNPCLLSMVRMLVISLGGSQPHFIVCSL